MRRIRTRVVKTSQGIMTTSTLNLRTAGMSLSTFGSRSKNRCRFRKIYAPPNKLTMKKNVAAIRKAGRTEGLICASMISVLSFATLSFSSFQSRILQKILRFFRRTPPSKTPGLLIVAEALREVYTRGWGASISFARERSGRKKIANKLTRRRLVTGTGIRIDEVSKLWQRLTKLSYESDCAGTEQGDRVGSLRYIVQ